MKKHLQITALLALLALLASSLCSCGLFITPSWIFSPFGKERDDDTPKAEEMLELIVDAINGKDPAKLDELFSVAALSKKHSNTPEDVFALFGEGIVLPTSELEYLPIVVSEDFDGDLYIKRLEWERAVTNVADGETYVIFVDHCTDETTENKYIGVERMIICKEEDVDGYISWIYSLDKAELPWGLHIFNFEG